MISIDNLEKDLKNEKIQDIYLLYGEETFLLETCLKKIKTLFGEIIKGINYVNIDETNYKTLISEIETPAFGFEKKLIIVKNSKIFGKDGKKKNIEMQEFRERLIEYIKENRNLISQSVVIVFVEEDVDARISIYKQFEKEVTVCKFEFLKESALKARIKAICNIYKVNINDSTISYFIESCGTSMQELINEIRKLIEYVGINGQIEKKDIDILSIKKIESIIFDLTDSLGKKDLAKSLEVLNNLIYAKEPVQKILITLYNHFKKIYFVQLAIKNNRDVVEVLNLKANQTFLVTKYKMQSKYFKETELRNILKKLSDLDYNSKNGLIDVQVGLESILCGLGT